MPKLFDLAVDNGAVDILKRIKTQSEREEEEARKARRREIIREHRKTHVFSTYEEALDWLIAHPGREICWHCWPTHWDKEKQLFVSYEQDFGVDGVIPTDVTRYYTKQERMEGHTLDELKAYGKELDAKYPELPKNDRWWLDEYGKLEYVYKYDD